MAMRPIRPQRRVRRSVSRDGLAPELGIAAATVAATAIVHWGFLMRVDQKPPLILFAATAVALTFWRGLGPGMVASSVGTAIGSSLFVVAPTAYPGLKTAVPLESVLWFSGSLFCCWLIYRLKSESEDVESHASAGTMRSRSCHTSSGSRSLISRLRPQSSNAIARPIRASGWPV